MIVNTVKQQNRKFVATEPISQTGQRGEQQVWDAVCDAFAQRDCLAYWRYPIFSKTGAFRKEPDILIVDANLGLIVIEVKSVRVEQIVGITGHAWEFQNFYTTRSNPYQQAEHQLFALLDYCTVESALSESVRGRAMLALPLISRSQWQQRGFDQLPSCPPILFQEDLGRGDRGEKQHIFKTNYSNFLVQLIKKIPPLKSGRFLTHSQWKLLQAVIAGTPLFRPATRRFFLGKNPSKITRAAVLSQVRRQIYQLDFQQENIAKQIPPGPQRIRGIAGSGKTILLCQKAAMMHLKYPDWDIAVVFFSRSLYEPITQSLDQWLRRFSGDRIRYHPSSKKLRVLHAWGSKNQPGLYSTLCQAADIWSRSVNRTTSHKPNEALAEACCDLLNSAVIPQLFDAILIDEGQDLIIDDDALKFENKQPFYWMAYQALRPVDSLDNKTPKIPQKRLIWAYDEVQSLDSLKSPTASEIFGDELGQIVTGSYPNGINKTEIMSRSYRIPHPILTAAHAIGMGLLRPAGMLTGMTHSEDWEAIGYQIKTPLIPGQKITLHRPSENSPNPIPKLWQSAVLEFEAYHSRLEEITALTEEIYHDLRLEGLRPSRELLVIVLGSSIEAMQLEAYIANFLIEHGLDIYIPGTSHLNQIKPDKNNSNPNQFWMEGAITISRIHRAKGQEADRVYLVGFDHIAKNEADLNFRNQLFVGLTRARGWARLTGTGAYPMYEEMGRVIESGDTFSFTYRPPQREIGITEIGELLRRYQAGNRNFKGISLAGFEITGINLSQANLIQANLLQTNLSNANLSQTKLVIANLSQAVMTSTNLHRAKLVGAILTNAQLRYANLSNADLTDADLRNAQLFGANLSYANLTHANLKGADLTEVNFTGTDLTQAIL